MNTTSVKPRPTVHIPAYFLGRPYTMYVERYAPIRGDHPREW